MTTAKHNGWLPSDFGDPTAFNLGEHTALGDIEMAINRVRTILGGLAEGFGIEKVQFFFNGTPAVMSVHDAPKDVLVDWNTRRTEFQTAAGI